jgi:hypothetical protein
VVTYCKRAKGKQSVHGKRVGERLRVIISSREGVINN